MRADLSATLMVDPDVDTLEHLRARFCVPSADVGKLDLTTHAVLGRPRSGAGRSAFASARHGHPPNIDGQLAVDLERNASAWLPRAHDWFHPWRYLTAGVLLE